MALPSNVFVLCTGRCGSLTLARACGHLSNWTAAHESRTHMVGPDRFAYPPRHVEVDNRLSWLLGRLDAAYGARAAYIHLARDPEAVAESFAARAGQGILHAYRTGILARAPRRSRDVPLIDFCRDYVATVTANIEHFLKDKPHRLDIRLETLEDDFDTMLDWIGAEGDLDAARAEIATRHNATGSAP